MHTSSMRRCSSILGSVVMSIYVCYLHARNKVAYDVCLPPEKQREDKPKSDEWRHTPSAYVVLQCGRCVRRSCYTDTKQSMMRGQNCRSLAFSRALKANPSKTSWTEE